MKSPMDKKCGNDRITPDTILFFEQFLGAEL
jgi:hypothetical protein